MASLAVTPSKKFDPYYAMLKGAHLGPHQHVSHLALPDEGQIRTLAQNGCNLVISHHPLIFKGLKRLVGGDAVQRLTVKAIQNNIAVYAMHTNLDNHPEGVNRLLCEKLGITGARILRPMEGQLRKLVTFCPKSQADRISRMVNPKMMGFVHDCQKFINHAIP